MQDREKASRDITVPDTPAKEADEDGWRREFSWPAPSVTKFLCCLSSAPSTESHPGVRASLALATSCHLPVIEELWTKPPEEAIDDENKGHQVFVLSLPWSF